MDGRVDLRLLRVAGPAGVCDRAAPDRLATLIEWIFNDSDQTYGHRRIHAALLRQGERLTPELVRAIMRELGLICSPARSGPPPPSAATPARFPTSWPATSTPTPPVRSSSGISPIS